MKPTFFRIEKNQTKTVQQNNKNRGAQTTDSFVSLAEDIFKGEKESKRKCHFDEG